MIFQPLTGTHTHTHTYLGLIIEKLSFSRQEAVIGNFI